MKDTMEVWMSGGGPRDGESATVFDDTRLKPFLVMNGGCYELVEDPGGYRYRWKGLARMTVHCSPDAEKALNNYLSLTGQGKGETISAALLSYCRTESASEIYLRHCAEHFDLTIGQITANVRTPALAIPRLVSMALAYDERIGGQQSVAELFGKRDSSSTAYALRRVSENADLSKSKGKLKISWDEKKANSQPSNK